MTHFLRRLTLALLLSSVPATTAFAQVPPPQQDPASKKLATDKFNRGLALYKEGSLDAALVEFQGAYQITPSWKILYNIGMVHRDKKDYRQALAAFDRFLLEGGREIDPQKRKEVEKEVATLRGFVGTLSIVTTPPGATVRIDDDPPMTSPSRPITVNSGYHRVIVTMSGYRDASENVPVAGQENKRFEIALQPLPPGGTTVVVGPPPEEPSPWDEVSFALIGVTGALAIGAGITGGLAFAGAQEIPETTFVGDTPSEELESDRTTVQALAITTDVLIGSAAAALAATFIFTYVHEPETPEPAPQPGAPPPPPVAKLRVGPMGAGLAVQGEW
jgi:hypothetical protein